MNNPTTESEVIYSTWAEVLKRYLDSPNKSTRQRVRRLLAGGMNSTLRVDDYRDDVWEKLGEVAAAGIGKIGIPEDLGGEGDSHAFLAAFETMAEGDLSLLIKFGVQFGLFGGSIQNLGTAHHHRKYLADAMSARLPGCFAMTEGDHGSNVAGLETTITYSAEDDTYTVDTPHEGAGKDYIGNAAQHGRMASVFGQLYVDEVCHGVHCVLVPIRDVEGNAMPGVRIADDGHKMGLNGVDNGRLWFDAVKVPREHLLDRFGGVNAKGKYTSPIAKESARFFIMLGTLVGGRVSIGLGGLTAAKRALKIAIDHAHRRRQFGEGSGPETLLMDYRLHQMRLIPPLADTYALHFALRGLVARYGENSRAYERHAAALKSAATWHATSTIQACREACGGAGYLSKMGFTDLKNDTDIFATFEGDNTVLQLLVAKEMVKDLGQSFKSKGVWGVIRHRLSLYSRRFRLGYSLTDLSVDAIEERLSLREDWLAYKCAMVLRRRIKDEGQSAASAFNDEGPILKALAVAYTDRIVFRSFREAVTSMGDSRVRAKLQPVLRLHGLSTLQRHAAWLVAHRMLSRSMAKRGLGKEIERLVVKLRSDTQTLANALIER